MLGGGLLLLVLMGGLLLSFSRAAWGQFLFGALFLMGKARVRDAGPFVPEQTIETVKEDIEWAKTQVGSESR